VIRVQGSVRPRPEGTVNPNLASGKVELLPRRSSAQPLRALPFQLDEEVREETRLKYRYIDLRRDEMQHRLRLRHAVTRAMRHYLDHHGFVDVETADAHQGDARGRARLPRAEPHAGGVLRAAAVTADLQALLMMAGFDRYYQIVRCFRDEDLRADRQPEFTQLDIETSFLTRDEITDLMEGWCAKLFDKVLASSCPIRFPA